MGHGGTRCLYCWGRNSNGQCGDGTDRYTPTQVGGSPAWSAVDAGAYHNIGIQS